MTRDKMWNETQTESCVMDFFLAGQCVILFHIIFFMMKYELCD